MRFFEKIIRVIIQLIHNIYGKQDLISIRAFLLEFQLHQQVNMVILTKFTFGAKSDDSVSFSKYGLSFPCLHK